jgi:hypothetical protein
MKRIGIAFLLAVGAIAAVFFLRRSEPAAPAPASEPKPAAAAPSAPQPAAAPLVGEAVPLPDDDGEHGEFTTSTDILKQQLFKTDPRLGEFDAFREHVLPDAATREAYRKLLADEEMIADVTDDLAHPKDLKDSMATNVKRLMQIDYLRESLAWKDNPKREKVMASVEGIISEDSFGAGMPADVKRSLAATKMELFEIFSGHDAERTAALVDKAKGTRQEKLVQYFAETNERRIAKERELSIQGQKPNP